jgi:methylmalonyl-CoA/ethylmalonyl-CoA epimerase
MFLQDNKLLDLRLHHVGIVTSDTKASAQYFNYLGYESQGFIIDEIQVVGIEMLMKENELLIELVQPINNNSPVMQFLFKNGVCTNHLCYEVDDIEETIISLRKLNFLKLFNPVPAIAFQNRLITYLYNKNVGLIELLES